MFIVLPLHRESLRQMMQKGRLSHSIKIQVLQMLKLQVCDRADHGDIKDFSGLTPDDRLNGYLTAPFSCYTFYTKSNPSCYYKSSRRSQKVPFNRSPVQKKTDRDLKNLDLKNLRKA